MMLVFLPIQLVLDGLMIEVNPDPVSSYSDGQQSLDIPSSEKLMKELTEMVNLLGNKSLISVMN